MHSPLRSESDVFKGVVVVVAGVAAAVGIGALTDAEVGALIAAVLVGIGLGALLRAGRGSMPTQVQPASRRDDAYRILVLANRTVEGPKLLAAIRRCCEGRASPQLLVISPALPRTRLQQLASDTDAARREADQRLRRSLETLRRHGLSAHGWVGDEDPVLAATDALRDFGADELIVSTLPPDRSRWLARGAVERIREQVTVPVRHVVSAGETEARTAPEHASA